ncbi:hypothetical protein [Cellulomonas sp. B6]|uniref:hypothetical protein n=1 Tax=Cellulomonas sp. B6 TaxID=1295626 RepID=UPI00073CEDF7|nr:hypothetical protein [Cellulomonas sp. B6]KSW29247.1 hypothetical protein ATM99_09195 [Cellulomonas sp. B6]
MSTPSGAPQKRWRFAAAVDEGLRNWRNGRWLTILTTVLVVAAATVPVVADGLGLARLVADERSWVAAGGRMLVVTNDPAGGVDRAACESTARVEGITASASLRRLALRAGVPNAPDARIPLVAVSEGIGPVLGLHPSTDGVILPPELADGLGVRAGQTITLTADIDPQEPAGATVLPVGPVPVAAVADTSVLGEDNAYAILLPTPAAGRAGACFVTADAGFLESVRAVLPTMLSADGQDAVVTDRLVNGEYSRDFSAEYATRGLVDAPWAVGASISLLWLLLVWLRRGRDGLYATLGADRATRAVIRVTEGAALVGTSMLLAAGTATAVLAVAVPDPLAVAPDVVRHLTIVTSVAVLGVLVSAVLPLKSPLAALKDR